MKYAFYIIAASIVLIAPIVTLAALPGTEGSALGKIDSASSAIIGEDTSVNNYKDPVIITGKITGVVNWFSWGIALVSVVMGLYAGFLFITARGEAAQLKTARATLLWAVIGVAVAVLAFSIIAITKAIFTLG